MTTTGGIKKQAIGRKDLFLLDPMTIVEMDGWNVRIAGDELAQHIRQLADSIKEIGVQQPLTVFMDGDSPTVTDGHCRLMAVKLAISEGAEIKSVPVRTEERFANEADRVLSMLVRNSGRGLTIPEQAEVAKRLLAFGWSESEIARKTGYTRQHVNNLVAFLSAPTEVRDMVNNGQVSATMAVEQVKKRGVGATDTLRKAVDVAAAQGKAKATNKHIVVDKVLEPEKDGVVYFHNHPPVEKVVEVVEDNDDEQSDAELALELATRIEKLAADITKFEADLAEVQFRIKFQCRELKALLSR